MNSARAEALLRGMTSVAQRIYQAVPIAEAWTAAQINAELIRGNTRIDRRVFQACLSALHDVHLIADKGQGRYQRTAIKEKPTAAIEDAMPIAPRAIPAPPTAAHNPTQAKPQPSPLDLLGALSARLRTLADEVDSAALLIDAQISANQEDMAKLKQLQSLLKSMTD